MNEIREKILNVNNIKTYCKALIHNPQNNTIVLGHGATANADAWMPVIMNFRQPINIIAPDFPGHYRSEGKAKVSIPELATFMDEFVKVASSSFGLIGPIAYVGHSLGGGVGIELGIRNVEWLSKLVLVTTGANLDVLSDEFLEGLKNGVMDNSFFKNGFSPVSSPKLLETILSRQGFISIETCYADFLAGSKFDRSQDLSKIKVETLIISGKDDRIMRKNAAQILHKGIPNNHWVQVENMGHFATLEQPKIVAKEIEKFLLLQPVLA